MTPTFQGEVQFRRYSDTSTQGASIVLSLPDRDELAAFIGKEGRRFMAVLVEVGDDEQPVQQPASVPKIGPICQWLVLRCNEPEFWDWLYRDTLAPEPVRNSAEAANVVRARLGVTSRKEIDGNPQKEADFHRLIRGPYSRWLLRRGVTA